MYCILRVLVFLMAFLWHPSPAAAGQDEVLVVGDMRLKPVVQVMAGIEEVMGRKVPIFSPEEARGRLADLVVRHAARAVIALGRQSIEEALTLPSAVTVIYDLVILPPDIDRPNTTGMYMGTPVQEYLRVVTDYLPDLARICVIASPDVLEVLDNDDYPQVTVFEATNTYDFIETIKRLESFDALLLLPDISLITNKALEEIYLFSFRKKVPLLGISKKHVRQGALFALEFDPESSGRNLGLMAVNALRGNGVVQDQTLPPKHYNLYINLKTARKMNIDLPEEMLEKATSVYP